MDRGSEWRKWDLHIHTPGTAKNDQYGSSDDIWEKYIDALEKTDVAVFGITDYFSIRNYQKVREFQKNGRLNGKYILPNVEMRLLPVTGKNTPINIHVIFDTQLTDDEIEREFFNCLHFSYEGANYFCIDSNLACLGRKVKNNEGLNDNVAIKKGIEAFAISYESLREVINKEFFKGHIMVALSNSSQDGVAGIMQHEGNLQPLRKEITKMADIILSGNLSDVQYFSGDKTSEEEVMASYRSLKPCIIGSDAHSLEQVGVFPNNRITWIKADPTFEGLKQILFEPKERVCISDIKPDSKPDYNIIDRVVLNTVGVWQQTISLNQNLNTIIGGRSTGKSTLLSSIAKKFQGIDNNDSSFIQELCDGVHVYWRDGQENDNKDIEYFTQNQIANILSKEKDEHPDKFFRNILIAKENIRKEHENYKADEAKLYSLIQGKVALLFEKRRQIGEKSVFLKTLGDKDGIEHEIEKLSRERDVVQLQLTDNKVILENYLAIEKKLLQLRDRAAVLKQEEELLKILDNSHFFQISPAISYSGVTEENYKKITEKLDQIISNSNSQMGDFVKSLMAETNKKYNDIVRDISEKQNEEEYKEGKQIFDANKNLSQVVSQITSMSKQLEAINEEMQMLDKLKKECDCIVSELMNEHLSYLDMMNSVASVLRIEHETITLSANYVLSNKLDNFLRESLSLRFVAMNDLIAYVVSQYSKKTRDKVKECLTEILDKALKEELSLKKDFELQNFITVMLSTNWYELKYDVNYEGDKLSEMSPGKRAFVVLKLLLDFSEKKCPILIDQPEDDLDNRSIYNELVKYIREKKKERQIILVTHNPNIVVGADAEEVIVANQNGKNAPNDKEIKFQYLCGSLENSVPRNDDEQLPILYRCGIREHVCDILEGGEKAFRDRENKYGYFKI